MSNAKKVATNLGEIACLKACDEFFTPTRDMNGVIREESEFQKKYCNCVILFQDKFTSLQLQQIEFDPRPLASNLK